MDITLSVTVKDANGGRVCAPLGMAMPGLSPVAFQVDGADPWLAADTRGEQWISVVETSGQPVTLTTRFAAGAADYPDALFTPRHNRFTLPAEALAAEARELSGAAGGGAAGLVALVNHVAGLFSYGHPEARFYDGQDEIPALCGMTEGSCVDINTYLVAALRAAGYEAGYVTGYFIPAEKRDRCDDMHCWVVTRHAGLVQEWDIAHHLKMGLRDIAPGRNPKPGVRVAMAHSMGHDLPSLGLTALKLLSQPVLVDDTGQVSWPEIEIRLSGYDALVGLEAGPVTPAAAAQ